MKLKISRQLIIACLILMYNIAGHAQISAQNKAALLRTWHNTERSVDQRLNAGVQLLKEYYLKIHSDSTPVILGQMKALAPRSKQANFQRARVLYYTGEWHDQQFFSQQRESYVDQALQLLKPTTHQAFLLYVDLHISKAYCLEHNHQDRDAAIRRLLKIKEEVLEKYPSSGLKQVEALWPIEFTLGNMYTSALDFSTAKRYYLDALRYFEATSLQVSTSIYTGLAVLYQYIDQADSAAYYIQAGLEKSLAQDNWRSICTFYLLKGNDLKGRGKLDSAAYFFNKALEYGEQLDWAHRKAAILVELGLLSAQQGQLETAIRYCSRAYREASNAVEYVEKKDPCRCLHEVYKASGDFRRALQYHEEYKRWADSMAQLSNNRVLARAEATYELNLIKKEQKIKLDRTNLFLGASILGVVFLTGILLFIIRLYVQKQKIAQMLESSNTKLQVQQLALSKSNEQLGKFANSISHDIVANLDLMLSVGKVLVSPRMRLQELTHYYEQTQQACHSLKNYCLNLLSEVQKPFVAEVSAPVDPMPILNKVLQQLLPAFKEVGLEAIVHPLTPLTIPPAIIEKVFLNLLLNTLNHGISEKAPKVIVRSEWRETQQVCWIVEDNGPGIPEDELNRLFTLRSEGHKKMGLSLLKATLQVCGATIWAEDIPNGARFVVAQNI